MRRRGWGARSARGGAASGSSGRGDVSGIEGWETIHVFVSSTFKDMQAERDRIREVFDEVAEELLLRRAFLVPIDLRWGVDTADVDEDERERRVLEVCLEEIRRSRPLFIGLIGDRYGWVPDEARVRQTLDDARVELDPSGLSITALEVEYGVLADANQHVLSRLYLRDPLPYEQMGEHAAPFVDDAAPPAAAGVEPPVDVLRERIRRKLPGRWHRYALGWDPQERALTGLDELALQVGAHLREDLDERLGDRPPELPSAAPAFAAARFEVEAFFTRRLLTVLGRDELVPTLVARGLAPTPPDRRSSPLWWWPGRRVDSSAPGVVLVGEAGDGKSAVLAEVWRVLDDAGVCLLTAAAGAGPRSSSVAGLLARWLSELESEHEPPLADDDDVAELRRRFEAALARRAEQERVVLLVDALDQFEDTAAGDQLTFLPDPLPPNVRLVASARTGDVAARIGLRVDVDVLALPALDAEDLRGIVHAVAQRHRRTINDEVVDALLEGRTVNPLWVRLATDGLLVLDEDDFARVGTYEGTPGDQLHALLCDVASSYPTDVVDLYAEQYRAAEHHHGALAAETFRLIGASRGGLRDADLRELLPRLGVAWDDLAFARFRRSLRGVFTRRADGRLDFLHAQGRAAAARVLAESSGRAEELHRLLVEHLEVLDPSDPLREEGLVFHLLGAGDGPRLAAALRNTDAPAAARTVLVGAFAADAERTSDLLASGLALRDAPSPASVRTVLDQARGLLELVLPSVRGRIGVGETLRLCEAVEAVAVEARRAGLAGADELAAAARVELAAAAHEAGGSAALVSSFLEGVGERADGLDPTASTFAADRLRGLAAERAEASGPAVAVQHHRDAHHRAVAGLLSGEDAEAWAGRCAASLLDLARVGADELDPADAELGDLALDRAVDLLEAGVGGPKWRGEVLRLRGERAHREGDVAGADADLADAVRLLDDAARAEPTSIARAHGAALAALAHADVHLDVDVAEVPAILAVADRHRRTLAVAPDSWRTAEVEAETGWRRAQLALSLDDDAALVPALAQVLRTEADHDGGGAVRRAADQARWAAVSRIAGAVERLDQAGRRALGMLFLGPGGVVLLTGLIAAMAMFLLGLFAGLVSLADWLESNPTVAGWWESGEAWLRDQSADGGDDAISIVARAANLSRSIVDGALGLTALVAPWLVAGSAAVSAAMLLDALRGATHGAVRDASWSTLYHQPADRQRLTRFVRVAGVVAPIGALLLLGVGAVLLFLERWLLVDRWEPYAPALSPAVLVVTALAAGVVAVAGPVLAQRRITSLGAGPPATAGLPGFAAWSLDGADPSDAEALRRAVEHGVVAPATRASDGSTAPVGRDQVLGGARWRAAAAWVQRELGDADAAAEQHDLACSLLDRLPSEAGGTDVEAAAARCEAVTFASHAGIDVGAGAAGPETADPSLSGGHSWEPGPADEPGARRAEARRRARRPLVERGLARRDARAAVARSLLEDATRVRDVEATAGDAAALVRQWSLASPADLQAQIDVAVADLAWADATRMLGQSVRTVALRARLRVRRLRGRGAPVPEAAETVLSNLGLGGKRADLAGRGGPTGRVAGAVARVPGLPGRMLGWLLGSLRDDWRSLVGLGRSSRQYLRYWEEAAPAVIGLLVASVVVAVLGFRDLVALHTTSGWLWLLGLLAALAFVQLCWLSPARRERGRRRRTRRPEAAATDGPSVVVAAAGPASADVAAALADAAGGTPGWWGLSLATLDLAPIHVRGLDEAACQALLVRLRGAGATATVAARGPTG